MSAAIQLTLDDLIYHQPKPNDVQNENASLGPSIFRNFLMLDKLESFAWKTAQIQYQDEYMTAFVPVQFGNLSFSNISDKNTGIPRLYKMGSEFSYIKIDERINKLIEDRGIYTVEYDKKLYGQSKGKDREIKDIPGNACFTLRPYENLTVEYPKIDEKDDPEEIQNKLLGAKVRLGLRFHDDWTRQVMTMPFEVQDLRWKDGVLVIAGSNEVSVTVEGFQKIRTFNDHILFDVYNEQGGYTRTITVMGNYKYF